MERILLAVSGGVDSMVMLELFARSSFKFGIAHCNFKLRGEDSFADEQLVRETAGQLGVRFHLKRFNTMAYAGKRGISMEMAARELRYAFLQETARSLGRCRIATAHQAEDNAETLLLNLCRGTGLRGLCGIPPVREGIIRPLLPVTREEILAYLAEYGLPHVEDSTNALEEGDRNLLRHRVLPVLRELSYADKKHFERIGTSCHSVEDALEAQRLGADYITAGHVFVTDCKKGLAPRGLDFLRNVCYSVDIPVYAIGGISPDNIASVRKCGAAGACVMSGFMNCPAPKAYIGEFNRK